MDRGGHQGILREANRRRVLGLLQQRGPLTRAELARQALLSRSTVSNIIGELLAAELVREIEEPVTSRPRSRSGRPGALVTLDPAAGAAVGIDVDHQRLRVVVANLAHTVLAEAEHLLDIDHDAREAMGIAADCVERVIEQAGVKRDRVIGVGMALPGPIEAGRGKVQPSSISRSWVELDDPAGDMSVRLGLPVYLDNDANLGALAEMMWGAGHGATDVAYVKVGTGIGAGLVIDGRIYRGAIGMAGEIGHTTMSEDGAVCRCGNRGCLERTAGVPALLETLRGSRGPDLTMQDLFDLALSGDVGSRRVIADAGRHIGIAVANLCNVLNPQLVIVGGPLSVAGDVLLDPLRASFARCALPAVGATTSLVVGSLGDRATALGAVGLVLRETEPLAGSVRDVMLPTGNPIPRRDNGPRLGAPLGGGSETGRHGGDGRATWRAHAAASRKV
jgi:predicted NBD/HSP70 family sugar kinase